MRRARARSAEQRHDAATQRRGGGGGARVKCGRQRRRRGELQLRSATRGRQVVVRSRQHCRRPRSLVVVRRRRRRHRHQPTTAASVRRRHVVALLDPVNEPQHLAAPREGVLTLAVHEQQRRREADDARHAQLAQQRALDARGRGVSDAGHRVERRAQVPHVALVHREDGLQQVRGEAGLHLGVRQGRAEQPHEFLEEMAPMRESNPREKNKDKRDRGSQWLRDDD